jgi:hypothetical protein
MHRKARFLMVGVLLITLSLAVFQAPLQAQDTGEPAATEDPCPAIIEAGMQPQDSTAPVATGDPAFEPCLEALVSTEADATDLATPDTSLATEEAVVPPVATDAVGPTIEATEPDFVYIPITVIHSNIFADAGRVWVIWHDPTTGALTASLGAYMWRVSYYNMSLDVTIPNNVVNIGIRIETTQNRSSDNWEFNPTCAFAFAKPPQGFSVNVDDDNVCTGQIDNSSS